MGKIEKIEMKAQHSHIVADMENLVEKYRAIFDWDIPEINQHAADKLILEAMLKALSTIQKNPLK